MNQSNYEKETKRLSEVYARATEEELRRLADQAYTLTDAARTALNAEIKRRELQIDLSIEPPSEKPPADLVTIRTFTKVADALLAKTVLDSAEIDSFLFDENTIRIDWFYSNALGGVKLRVRPDDAAEALELLNQSAHLELSQDENSTESGNKN
jgi:hypothetical protein